MTSLLSSWLPVSESVAFLGAIGAVTHSRDNHHLDNDVPGIITERIGHDGFRPAASYEVSIQ